MIPETLNERRLDRRKFQIQFLNPMMTSARVDFQDVWPTFLDTTIFKTSILLERSTKHIIVSALVFLALEFKIDDLSSRDDLQSFNVDL